MPKHRVALLGAAGGIGDAVTMNNPGIGTATVSGVSWGLSLTAPGEVGSAA
ncbi:hypothetical protein [Halomonas icarae]|uniref:Uncharacterized protein n=1 Tax=Halomonas icarae TaxID=2691040 RepID=A0A7X5AMM2_9GAMM|nr:hypothetical protein [Halomonas icarae]MDR5901655.1 hypothetical protein [Halomonas icarae]NAW13004.1 hypothetical protein [Halomonas icarae]